MHDTAVHNVLHLERCLALLATTLLIQLLIDSVELLFGRRLRDPNTLEGAIEVRTAGTLQLRVRLLLWLQILLQAQLRYLEPLAFALVECDRFVGRSATFTRRQVGSAAIPISLSVAWTHLRAIALAYRVLARHLRRNHS